MVRGGQSNVPPFPSGLGGNSDQMFRELYARVHGAETRVLTVPGEDDGDSPEPDAIPVLASLPVRSIASWVNVTQGYWSEPGNAVLIASLVYPAIVLDIQVTIVQLQSPIIRDINDVVQHPSLFVGIGDGEGFSNDKWQDRTFFAQSSRTLDTQNVVSAAWGLNLTRRRVVREPVDRLGAVLKTRLTSGLVDVGRAAIHVYAGFSASMIDVRPEVSFPRGQRGAALVTLTYVDGHPGDYVEGVPLLLASEPL